MSPCPSKGAPRASITRPQNASPTGIPARFPVLATREPSVISTSRPKRITPISFRRISCTMPLMPESNSTISPYMAWSIPSMLAIPSATDLTTPISMPLASKSKFSISVFKMEIIPSVEVEFLICSIFCSNCFIRPLVLQSNSSPPARITKPSPREGSSSSSKSISSLPNFRIRKFRIPISCSSVGFFT